MSMSDQQAISVNFGKPMPIFPLASLAMLPQQVVPLHIFEPRYRQMVEDVLDGAGQIAMAVFDGAKWEQEYHGNPPVRPVVCIGQLVQHEKLPDGRYNILLHGVCRAKIAELVMPDEEHQYRRAVLEPFGVHSDENELLGVRDRLEAALSNGPLRRMAAADPVLEYLRNEEVPTTAVLELISFTMLSDSEVRYRLLAEPNASKRAGVVEHELSAISSLLRRAEDQHPEDWPKGCSWN